MKKIFALLFIAFIVSSCNDESEEQPSLVTNNDDYHPNTKGTNWNYEGFLATKMSVTGSTKEIDGNVYAQLKTTFPDFGGYSIVTYLRKEDGNYYYRGEGFNGDYLFLKDNVSVGTTWTSETKIDGVVQENELEIIEVDVSYQINTVTFNDVIVVKVTSYDSEDPEVSYDMFNYYAKGVGLVLSTDGSEFLNQSITTYSIK